MITTTLVKGDKIIYLKSYFSACRATNELLAIATKPR